MKINDTYPVTEYKGVKLREVPMSKEARLMDNPALVAEFCRNVIMESARYTDGVENFFVILLNTRRRVIGFHVMSTGTLDTLLVHPREVFRLAVIEGAAAIVVSHNHPSGDPTPSEQDIRMTRDLMRAGQLMRIEIMDHVIIGEATPERPRDYVSLRELGYFYT